MLQGNPELLEQMAENGQHLHECDHCGTTIRPDEHTCPACGHEQGLSTRSIEQFARTAPVTNRGGKMPENLIQLSPGNVACIAFDWIEVTGKKGVAFLQKDCKIDGIQTNRFKVEEREGFPDIRDVSMSVGGVFLPIGTLWVAMSRGHCKVDNGWCKFKLKNSWCYTPGHELKQIIKDLFYELDIIFKHFNRLDLAMDFQKTDYRGISPQVFMNKCARREYIFKGKKAGMEDKGQDLKQHGRGGRVETLTIGKRKSGLAINMYNKSAEMRARVYKPYIVDQWEMAGFDNAFDTYRIEFQCMKSLKSIFIYDGKRDGVEVLSHTSLDVLDHLEDYLRIMYKQHFQVGIYQPDTRFARLKPVNLFHNEIAMYSIVRTEKPEESNNHDKYAIKKMLKAGFKAQRLGLQMRSSELFQQVRADLTEHKLHSWFEKKYPNINLNDSILTYEDLLTSKEARSGRLVLGQMFSDDMFKNEGWGN
jgi:ribosomal protein L32